MTPRATPLALVVVCLALVGWIAWQWRAPAGSGPVTIAIAQGQGLKEIATLLHEGDVIRSPRLFTLAATLTGRGRNLKAGRYTFERGQSLGTVLAQLAAGQADEVRVVLVEGWTARAMGEALERAGVVSAEAFAQAASATDSRTILPDATYAFLPGKPTTASLEGYLFPDTYLFKPETLPEEVVGRLLENFGRRVPDDLRAKAASRGRSFFEVLTVASMVEREVAIEEDRRLVADIFWRRLARPMRLESDATVNYVTGKDLPAVTVEDTQVDSPYNTYRVDGLPPGPIGNPGLVSIRAVLDPKPNEFFYFLTDKDGKAHYARTFEEHVVNKEKYLR